MATANSVCPCLFESPPGDSLQRGIWPGVLNSFLKLPWLRSSSSNTSPASSPNLLVVNACPISNPSICFSVVQGQSKCPSTIILKINW